MKRIFSFLLLSFLFAQVCFAKSESSSRDAASIVLYGNNNGSIVPIKVDSNGVIDTSGGGTITGSGVAGQVTYWDGASSITGNTSFLYDTTNGLTIGSTTANPGGFGGGALTYRGNAANKTGTIVMIGNNVTGGPFGRFAAIAEYLGVYTTIGTADFMRTADGASDFRITLNRTGGPVQQEYFLIDNATGATRIKGAEAENGILEIWADEGDDTADKWLIQSLASNNNLTITNGSTAVLNLTTTALSPSTNDGVALGTTALQFSDLFLAEGGVINWDNGDATLTQVGNTLTLAGADLNTVLNTDATVQSGTNPTVNAAGEVGVDTSSGSGSNFRFYGDAGYQISGYYSKSFVMTGVTSAGDFGNVWRSPWAITIRAIHCLAVGGTSVTGQLNECDANGANCAVVDSSDLTCTAATNVNDDGTLSNPSIDANDYIGWSTTSVSGTNTNIAITFEYTIDAVA